MCTYRKKIKEKTIPILIYGWQISVEKSGMKESLSVVVAIIYHISKGAWG
jgi:hypothetical protein